MDRIVVRFGDLILKGRNRNVFVNILFKHVKNALANYETNIHKNYDAFEIEYHTENEEDIKKLLKDIPGIHSFYKVYTLSRDINECANKAVEYIKNIPNYKNFTYKVETRRSDKMYELRSIDFSMKIAPIIIKQTNIKVDVRNPEITILFEIHKDAIYLSLDKSNGLGGFPYGVSGKALVMLSGGIDSPVSAFLAAKQGLEIELFHFESSPLTPLEATQKVLDIAKVLSKYTINQSIQLHFVSLNELHQAILTNVVDSYIITILRRMMYRFADRYSKEHNIDCIINGESLGQVASQTINSIKTITNKIDTPILRPLITYDKNDIIKISRQISTFDISIRAFNDCCSIYVPKNPAIKPRINICEIEEAKFDYQSLIDKIYNNIITLEIKPNTDINICDYGLEFNEAINNYVKRD